jgi:hypothetical protein
VANHRHKRDARARTLPRAALVAAPVAVLATVSAVSFGVVSQTPEPDRDLLAQTSSDVSAAAVVRAPVVSRSQSRAAAKKERQQVQRKAEQLRLRKGAKATRAALRSADTRLWTTEDLNIWTLPAADADKVGILDAGEKVLITGRERGERQEIVLDGESRWVTVGYLDDDKPVAGIGGTCTNGTSVPSGVDPNITKVHQAVCAAFPDVSSYGTFRNDGEHGQGRAVDIMISGERGWEIAEFVRKNYVALGVEYLIYSQKIWSVERGGEGWRGMSNRGSTTANHYDHVHVTVY